MKKKVVAINTDYPLVRTGLARNGKELANYLYKTGKYEIIYYSCGVQWSSPEFERFPYKIVGTLPNNRQDIESIQRDPQRARDMSYGAYNIDKFIQEFKPDVFIISNDSWAAPGYYDKIWWNKINCIPHITLDSLPFAPHQKEFIQKSNKFYVWADFAVKEAKRLGYNNVERLTGIIDPAAFRKLSDDKKLELRRKNRIPDNAFICGYIFRNQIRKECHALLEGFAGFKRENPKANAYLLFHTHFDEPLGWNIPQFCDELNLDKSLILTTYVCKICRDYEIKPYGGQELNCPHCGKEKTQTTCQVTNGITENQLNEVYNLMDCYSHLMNSGGLEVPIAEALYCELPTSTVGYSCGEMFTDQPFVYPIAFDYTVQHGSQFKRAVPRPFSVTKFLKKIYEMDKSERNEIGKAGRKWALENFSIEVVGKQWENILDNLPEVNWDFNFQPKQKNPNAIIEPTSDDSKWLISLYREILGMKVDENDSGMIHWLGRLRNGDKRDVIEKYFRSVAETENQKLKQFDLSDLLDKNDNKRVLVTLPESVGDLILSTALFESIRDRYPAPEWKFYFATKPEYFEILDGNPYVDKVIPYIEQFDNHIWLTGSGEHKGYFDVVYHLHFPTQRMISYLNNGIDKIDLK